MLFSSLSYRCEPFSMGVKHFAPHHVFQDTGGFGVLQARLIFFLFFFFPRRGPVLSPFPALWWRNNSGTGFEVCALRPDYLSFIQSRDLDAF